MKVFVTGATGVLGRRGVSQLLAAGAEVTGVARTRRKGVELHDLGATPVQVSLFDRDALTRFKVSSQHRLVEQSVGVRRVPRRGFASRASFVVGH